GRAAAPATAAPAVAAPARNARRESRGEVLDMSASSGPARYEMLCILYPVPCPGAISPPRMRIKNQCARSREHVEALGLYVHEITREIGCVRIEARRGMHRYCIAQIANPWLKVRPEKSTLLRQVGHRGVRPGNEPAHDFAKVGDVVFGFRHGGVAL